MEFNEEDLERLTHLCKIECSEEEKKRLLRGLKKIISYIEQLDEIDTNGVKTCHQVTDGNQCVMRDDVVEDILSRELFLANAPDQIGGMIRVPPVIKF